MVPSARSSAKRRLVPESSAPSCSISQWRATASSGATRPTSHWYSIWSAACRAW